MATQDPEHLTKCFIFALMYLKPAFQVGVGFGIYECARNRVPGELKEEYLQAANLYKEILKNLTVKKMSTLFANRGNNYENT